MTNHKNDKLYLVARESIELVLRTWQSLLTKGATNKEVKLSALTVSTYIKAGLVPNSVEGSMATPD